MKGLFRFTESAYIAADTSLRVDGNPK